MQCCAAKRAYLIEGATRGLARSSPLRMRGRFALCGALGFCNVGGAGRRLQHNHTTLCVNTMHAHACMRAASAREAKILFLPAE